MSMMMWSIKERRREPPMLTACYDVPFTAIALIFLMNCSPGKFLFCYSFKLTIFEEIITRILSYRNVVFQKLSQFVTEI